MHLKTYSISFIKIFSFIIIFLFIMIYFTSYIHIYIHYVKSILEFKKNEYYFKFCNLNNLKKANNEKEFIPKISIISPIYNSDKFIIRFLKCIQYQNYNKIEIIMVDDFSKDNSVKIIENLRINDNRVKLIKNKQNKGTFMARNIGILYSKGTYIIAPDPDDILSKNILDICFKYAEKYNFDMIRFNMYIGNKKLNLEKIIKNLENKEIYQPKLSTLAFYGNNELSLVDYTICNKFIRREVLIKALDSLNNFYFKIYITYSEDTIINFILYRISKSYIFLNKIGYYYIKNNLSITNNLFKKSKIKIQFIFILINFIFENSKNTKYEKDMCNLLFTKLVKENNIIGIFINKKNFHFFDKIIKKYFNSKYIEKSNKHMLKKIKYF